jgi:hypothetical protein
MAKSLRCRLGIHSWRKDHNDAGQMYLTCRRCGKNDDPQARVQGAPYQ